MPGSIRLALTALGLLMTSPAWAAACHDPAGFEKWLGDIEQEAIGQGIAPGAVKAALSGITFDPVVIRKDHGQGVFKQSFEQFSGRMVSPYRLKMGASLLKKYSSTLERIEHQFGVPGPVLVAIWGLETDFGAVKGDMPTIRSVATLAYDCRRTEMFQSQLFAALRIVERGDLSAAEMRGAWAGELGQTQLMPQSYLQYAVDFDGDGRADLLHSAADVLASTANYLKDHGWMEGKSWELGEPNFNVLREWNKSEVYSRTVALLASRLAAGSESAPSR